MADDQRHGRIFGVLFIITFITSIAALALFQPVLDDPVGYITGGGKDNQIYLGALLEFFLVISNVGTAVVLYPIARRQNEALAIGYVASSNHREHLHRDGDHLRARSRRPAARSSRARDDAAFTLAALKDWTFLFGPGLIVPFGNGLILGYLMYKSGLVPRRMAWLGLIGGPAPLHSRASARSFEWWDAGSTCRASWSSRRSSGRRSSASTAPSGGSGRTLRSSARPGAATPRPHEHRLCTSPVDPSANYYPARGSGCWPCPGWSSRCSFSSAGSRAVATRPTTAHPIRSGRTGRMTTSGRAASVRSRCCSQASCFCTSRRPSELRSGMRKQELAVLRNSLGSRLRVP